MARLGAEDHIRSTGNKVRESRGNIKEMIPTFAPRAWMMLTVSMALLAVAAAHSDTPGGPGSLLPVPPMAPANCLPTGDGYLRAHVAGAIDAQIDWPNSGTRCEGESREKPPGVRLSFQRASGAAPNLLLVFGVTGVRKGEAARELGVNVTVFVQGTNKIFGTQGDSRCTVDTLKQSPLQVAGSYRIEARGFCTQPAHAVRGRGDVLVSTFEFAGPVVYQDPEEKAP
jgi:hypothetical protein